MHFLMTIFFFCLLISGCDSLKNQADRISIDCGLPKSALSQTTYLKIYSSQGLDLTESDSQSVKAVFKPNTSDQRVSLPVTPRGCLILPRDPGLIQVVDPRNGDFLTAKNTAEKKNFSIIAYRLSPKPEFQASLACKDDGLFASRSLAQPLIVNLSGEPAGLEVRLDLFNAENSYMKSLYHKPMGESQLKLPATLDVADIDEGAYFLKIYGHHIAEGIDGKPRLLNTEQNCRLTILRGDIKIGGLAPALSNSVFAPDSVLPWQTLSPYETLNVCAEPRAGVRPAIIQQNACKPQLECKDLSNFKATSVVKTEKSGVYDFFVFSENRAGERSPLSCQTIIVSENPPALSVSWKHEDLKKADAILRKPYAVLQAEIEVNHELVESRTLERNLMCKVDFEIKGRNLFADKSVVCTEGLCQGKSLSEFVPCSRNLSFTLVDALNQPMLLSSRLRLQVRASDGAGHISQTEKSIWINKSVWTVDDLSYAVDDSVLPIESFLIDRTGDVVASFGSRVAVLKGDRWINLDSESVDSYTYQIARSREGDIRIARSVVTENGNKVDVLGYQSGKLVTMSNIQSITTVERCNHFLMGPKNTPYCLGIKVDDIYRMENGEWNHIEPPVPASDPLHEKVITWRILNDGRIAGLADSTLLLLNGKTWSMTNLLLPDLQSSYDLIEDFKGRLWFYSYKGPTNAGRALHLLDGNQLKFFPAKYKLTQNLSVIDRPLSSEGLKHFTVGLQRFNFTNDQWETLPYPESQLEKLKDSQSQMNDSGRSFEYLSNQGVFEENDGFLYWPMKELGSSLAFLNQDIERFQDKLYFIDNTTVTNKVLRRIRINFISAFDSKILETDDSFAIGSRSGSQGETDIYFFDGTQVTINGGIIETRKSPAPFDGSLQVIQLNENKLCYSTFHGLWVYDRTDGRTVMLSDRGTEESQGCLMTRRHDIWWINIKTKTIQSYDGEKVHTLTSFQAESDESLEFLNSYPDSDLTMLVTNRRIAFFKDQGELHSSLDVMDISAASDPKSIKSAFFISQNLVLITTQNNSRQLSHYLYAIPSKSIAEATEFALMAGNASIQQIKSNKTGTYILTSSKDAVIIEWKNGVWRKIGMLNDFAPLIKRKNTLPWWFIPDDQGHLWMITRSPYSLLRVDLDFAP